MDLKNKEGIKALCANVKRTMSEYMEDEDVGYIAKDVDKCLQILEQHLDKMTIAKSKREGMLFVKKTVLALNELNEKCDHELIETNQREDIAEIIIMAGHLKGYNDMDDDISEDWREW